MPDVMHYIRNSEGSKQDPDGNLLALDNWDRDIASKTAEECGITLTDEHFRILQQVRDYYRDNAPCNKAREILKVMEDSIGNEDARKTLYRMFPAGPVVTVCTIAHIPVPPDCVDPSFGISQ